MRAPRADTGIHPPSAGGATSVLGDSLAGGRFCLAGLPASAL